MSNSIKYIIAVVLIAAIVFFAAVPVGRGLINRWFFAVQKIDDVTNYDTIKEVEDTCRAMIASYNADKTTYESCLASEDSVARQMAESAKIRANRTAVTYNEYILKNSFVWKDNIPSDIKINLEVIK